MDFHTWVCMGFGPAGCRKTKQNSPINSQANDFITWQMVWKLRRHTRRITFPPIEPRQTLDLLLWLCRAFLPLSHPFLEKAAMLVFKCHRLWHLHGSGRLVLYLCALLPTQPSGEQHCAAAALGLASLVFWGGGQCVVGCLGLVLCRRDMQLCPVYSRVMFFGSL